MHTVGDQIYDFEFKIDLKTYLPKSMRVMNI